MLVQSFWRHRLVDTALLMALAIGPLSARAASPPPLRVSHAAVASDHPAASTAGAAAMKAGGNAVDAACATALALGVVSPQGSGIGGGGFALVYLAREKKVHALDFRETAPAALRPELFLRDGRPDPALSRRGGLAVGVPGEVRGLAELVRRWGKRSFAACVRPAEQLARGTRITPEAAETLADMGRRQPETERFLASVYTLARPFALPVRPGEVVRRPALARTLARLRTGGPEAFYRGPIARAIADATRAAGGVMTTEDLAGYAAVDRTPLATSYRGYSVQTMPPPSSGGVVITQALGILSHRIKDPPRGPGRFSSEYLHELTEALKHGFADRARHLGDPDFAALPLQKLVDPAYHRELAARVKPEAVLAAKDYGWPGPATQLRDGGTAHVSVMDAEGNAVALTTTVNLWFGAQLVAGDTGIVLNNQIDDFSLAPDVPNAFGLIGKDKNAVAPRKRPLSSMSPTIVTRGDQVVLAVGGAGGPTIISGTLQVLLNVIDGGLDAQAASASPRIHHQWSPETLALEPEIPADVVKALERRGHATRTRPHIAKINVVVRAGQVIEAAAEVRGGGAPAGY